MFSNSIQRSLIGVNTSDCSNVISIVDDNMDINRLKITSNFVKNKEEEKQFQESLIMLDKQLRSCHI